MAAESEGIARLIVQLQEALPGFEPLDSDLTLGDVRAQLVGRGGDGRLVLVRQVDQVDGQVVTELLDLLAAARSQGALLARHVGAGFDGANARVVLVARSIDERSARWLSALDQDAVRVLEVREIESERATSTFLVARGEEREPPSADSIGERLTGLDPSARGRAEVFVERMCRVDAELVLTTTEEGLDWHWRGRPICRLVVEAGQPRVGVGSADPRPMSDEPALEVVLDQAIARWISVTEQAEGLGVAALHPPAPRPLVGPEELDALRD